MSLRSRLLLALGAVVLVALLVADVVTYSSLRSFLLNQIDQNLTQASRNLQATLPRGGPPSSQSPGNGNAPPTPQGRGGTFVEVRSPDGTVLHQSAATEPDGKSYSPALPANIQFPQESNGVEYFDAKSTTPNGPGFRVRASQTPAGIQIITALPLDSTNQTLNRLLLIEIAVTGGALIGAAGLGFWLVRVGLRPLTDVERTADAIAGGALDRRVPGESERTEVGRLARTLNIMLERIQRAFTERDATERQLRASEERMRQFVADASHELRTPLSAVSAYAELFSRGADHRPADLERVMRGIGLESERMRVLVEDLMLLARLDEGRPLERRAVELVSLASEAVQSAVTVGPEWPVTLHADQPVEVSGDNQRLRQVMDNLLANVRAHTPSGTRATVSISHRHGGAIIEVADRGPGLTADQAAHVFERFYRADPSRTRQSGGAGLGLSIVAAIVSAHGGRVAAMENPTGGTLMSVWLPLDQPPSADSEKVKADPQPLHS